MDFIKKLYRPLARFEKGQRVDINNGQPIGDWDQGIVTNSRYYVNGGWIYEVDNKQPWHSEENLHHADE